MYEWLSHEVRAENAAPMIPKGTTQRNLHPAVRHNQLKSFLKMVPGGGIEPPTRGFSIHCSTPELPGHG